MHLEDTGRICKAAMDALSNCFELEKNVLFWHLLCQAIQGTNEQSINFGTKLHKLVYTGEFINQSTKIWNQSINKCSSNRLCFHLLQEPNLTQEKVVKNVQPMELAEKQSIIMQPKEMHIGMEVLKVTQDKYDFPSSKCCSPCESSTRFVNM